MNTDTTLITTVAAIAAPFITAVLQREHWSSQVKRWVAILVSLILAGIVVGVTRPTGIDVWTILGMVLGGSTIVYAAVYPAANRITQSGTAPASAKDTVSKASSVALTTTQKLDQVIAEALEAGESSGVVSGETVSRVSGVVDAVGAGVTEATQAAADTVDAADTAGTMEA